LRGLTCRRVDRKCDGHTHRHRHTHTEVNLYSVHAQHWTDNKLRESVNPALEYQ